jgi:RNA-binding protein
MKKNLSDVEKKALRKKAHSLKPVVMIGQHGLTDAVLAEVDIALNAHELIKVRIRGADKNERTEQCAQIKHQLNAEVVHQIGGIAVLYRPATC